MEFSTKAGTAAKASAGCVVVGAFEGRKLSPPAKALDAASGNALSAILKRGDLEGPAGRTLMLHDVAKLAAERVLVVNLGREAEGRALRSCATRGRRRA